MTNSLYARSIILLPLATIPCGLDWAKPVHQTTNLAGVSTAGCSFGSRVDFVAVERSASNVEYAAVDKAKLRSNDRSATDAPASDATDAKAGTRIRPAASNFPKITEPASLAFFTTGLIGLIAIVWQTWRHH